MTPNERAAQIWCKPYMASKAMDVELCFLIAAAIREAVEESKSQSNQMVSLLSYDLGVADGKALAYEDAAQVCEKPNGVVSRDYIRYAKSTVAPEIRALAAEEGK